MSPENTSIHAALPSVDRLLRVAAVEVLLETHGRAAVTDGIREILNGLRQALSANGKAELSEDAIVQRLSRLLGGRAEGSLRSVFNLTGTVLHTNLGRAPLPPEAIAAMTAVAAGASNLEYDLASGKRGDRDSHVEELLCRLTGAEAATAVNNNAAAVLLVLNTLAQRKQVPVSRGELIEIGGAFRIPDIMKRAGCKLVEVGTTNRTHARDFETAICDKTALIMKVHTSNYVVEGFTSAVRESDLAAIAHKQDLPFVVDLGSGTLVDFRLLGLPHEPTAGETLAQGADLVTFSGDKLLGGPQAGLIVGRGDLIAKIKRNPMKRALRLDKVTIAALGAVLRLYDDPDRLAQRLPALRLLTRPADQIHAMAERILPVMAKCLEGHARITLEGCQSQIGSGSLPVERLASWALALRPEGGKLDRLAAAFRALPVPVIGRVHKGALLFDLRCLEDEAGFRAQLSGLAL